MDVRIVYLPSAYAYMPHMAPFLLKGYIEANSAHRVKTQDLNIRYHLRLWSADFADAAMLELDRPEDRPAALMAEALKFHGAASFRALRDERTYASSEAVRAHAALLRDATRVERAVDRRRGAGMCLPSELHQWQRVVERLEASVVGEYLAEQVDAGIYDDADVVGLSLAYQEQLPAALMFARLLKRRRARTVVVVGGGAITHFLDDILRDPSFFQDIDYAIPYEGEHSFVQLLDGLANGRPTPPDVVWFDGAAARYRKNLMNRPKAQGAPDFSELEHLYPTPEPIYPVLTSKGCYWGKCTYCTHYEGYGQGYWRLDDASVDGTLKSLMARGARYFYLVDEALPPAKLTQLAELFEGFQAQAGDGLERAWMAEARTERSMANAETAELLKRSGCKVLISGIESGCQEISDKMKKGVDVELVATFARRCAAVGIRVGWMFFIGLPGETEAQARETFEYIARNSDAIDYAVVGTFTLERGSPAWDDPAAHSIRAIHSPDKAYPSGFDIEVDDGTVVTREALEARLRGLFREYARLRPLFEGAIDRALTMFLPSARASRSETRPENAPEAFVWPSQVAGGVARLYPVTGRIEITRPRPSAERHDGAAA